MRYGFKPHQKPRKGRTRDAAYRDFILCQPSIVETHDPNCNEIRRLMGFNDRRFCPVSGHHVKIAPGAAKQDSRMVPLYRCRHLHDYGIESVERLGRAEFERRFNVDFEVEIARLNKLYSEEKS